MNSIVFYCVILFMGLQCLRADEQRFENTASPHGLCVVQLIPNDTRSIKFFDSVHHKILGNLFPPNSPDVQGVVCSWSPKEDKVAVLYYYGTKLSDINLYERSKVAFERIPIALPEVEEVYKTYHKRAYKFALAGEASDNAVGPWVDNNMVKLIVGNFYDVGVDTRGYPETSSLLVILTVQIMNGKAIVVKQKLLGPLSDKENNFFFQKWGDKYQ